MMAFFAGQNGGKHSAIKEVLLTKLRPGSEQCYSTSVHGSIYVYVKCVCLCVCILSSYDLVSSNKRGFDGYPRVDLQMLERNFCSFPAISSYLGHLPFRNSNPIFH